MVCAANVTNFLQLLTSILGKDCGACKKYVSDYCNFLIHAKMSTLLRIFTVIYPPRTAVVK